jgi:hypothetical protein
VPAHRILIDFIIWLYLAKNTNYKAPRYAQFPLLSKTQYSALAETHTSTMKMDAAGTSEASVT